MCQDTGQTDVFSLLHATHMAVPSYEIGASPHLTQFETLVTDLWSSKRYLWPNSQGAVTHSQSKSPHYSGHGAGTRAGAR